MGKVRMHAAPVFDSTNCTSPHSASLIRHRQTTHISWRHPYTNTLNMESRPKLYASVAFVAGILLTLGYKDFYPDLEFRFWRRRKRNRTLAGAGLSADGFISLEDHEAENGIHSENVVPKGIEACIGNTPLFKVESLSQETGCEILVKAEVHFQCLLLTYLQI